MKDYKKFSEEIGKEILEIKDVSKGCDQDVFIIKCKDDNYVYKKPKKDIEKLKNEIKGCKLAKELGIPAPIIIKSTKNYLIQSYSEGTDLSDIKASKKIYFELGKYIKNLHSIKLKPVNHRNIFETGMPKFIENLKKLLPEYKNQISKYFETNIYLLDNFVTVNTHSDLNSDNIRVKNNKITGIIDWADLEENYPEHDIGCIYLEYQDNIYFKSFLKGYGNCNLDLVKFDVATRLTWMLTGNLVNKKNNSLTKKRLKIYLDIIDGK